jgi:tetratricopeptide (TPR) repeat protein
LQPDNAEAANSLGVVLLARGDFAAGAAQFRESLRLRPDFATAHNNLGNALRLTGDKEQALAHFRRAVELEPSLAEARSNLGQFLLEQGQAEEALAHCREAVRLRPHFPEALNNLGNVLRETGKLVEARSCYAESLQLNPHLAMTYNNMAQALQEEGRLDDALHWYRQALEREPGSARFHTNLASALAELEREPEAVRRYQAALDADPHYAEGHHGLGLVRDEQGRFDEALACFRTALRLRPDFAGAHCSIGTVLQELGKFDAALASFREGIRLDPRLAGARAQMATLLRGRLPEEDLAVMRQALADPDLSDGKRAALHFGVASVLDARGDHDAAAEHLRQGNTLRAAGFCQRHTADDPAEHKRFVDNLIAAFTPEFFDRGQGFGHESVRPIFIVGLPRAGTTLSEQVLASPSQVHGGGELRLARLDFESLPRIVGLGVTPFDCLPYLGPAAVRHVAESHLRELAALNATAAHVADKLPDNYLYLGLIALLFPRAKLIHCRRDLRDTAFSCWMTNFSQIRWAFVPDHIAARFQEYQRVMEHWSRVLPVPVLEVEYEAIVADLEGNARRLVQWCGLEWEPACLEFYKTKRPIKTASVAQVRQPIYRTSVARWKHYEKSLAELFAKLPITAEGQSQPSQDHRGTLQVG